MLTYFSEKPTGNERYNVIVPEVKQNIVGIGETVIGSIDLKGVTADVANAIVLLCNANNVPGRIELVEDDALLPRAASGAICTCDLHSPRPSNRHQVFCDLYYPIRRLR